MKKTTPPKHKTPNWKLVRHSHEAYDRRGLPVDHFTWTWQPIPLRADRKDLNIVQL